MGNTIDEPTAIAWTTASRARHASGATKAYLIPLDDLQGAIDEIKNQGGDPMARAYLAYGNVDGKPAEDKLVIVGTTQEPPSTPGGKIIYRDMIPSRDPSSSIWDFTEPCPQACDGTSPLNS
ncbi:MAG: hypothetical protein AAF489_00075 [Bacteroidota bacterium]